MNSTETDSRLKQAFTERSTRTLTVFALLAVLPAMAFAFNKSLYAGTVTSINVVVIFVSLYLLASPTQTDHKTTDPDDTAA